MSEMVERVRIAIDALIADWLQEKIDDDALARAAIAAMREPTKAMLSVGVDVALRSKISGEGGWPKYVAEKHRAMIDEALK